MFQASCFYCGFHKFRLCSAWDCPLFERCDLFKAEASSGFMGGV